MTLPLIDLLHLIQFVGLCGIFALALARLICANSPETEEHGIPPRFFQRLHVMLGCAVISYNLPSIVLALTEEGISQRMHTTHTIVSLTLFSLFLGLRLLHRHAARGRIAIIVLCAVMQVAAIVFAMVGSGSFMGYIHRFLGICVVAAVCWITLDQYKPVPGERVLSPNVSFGRLGATIIICTSLLQFGAGLFLLSSYGDASSTFLASISHASVTFIASLVGVFLLIIFAFLALALRGKRGERAVVVALWLTLIIVLVGMFAARRVLRAPQATVAQHEVLAKQVDPHSLSVTFKFQPQRAA